LVSETACYTYSSKIVCEASSMPQSIVFCYRSYAERYLKCSYCQAVHIGETGRTIGSRIKEHLRRQTVYAHLASHSADFLKESPIRWKILHPNIKFPKERKVIEALEIRKHSTNIMNGCVGRFLCI